MRQFSFFRWKGGSGEIRGSQIAAYLGARVNPLSDYENDTCIWVKGQPPETYPKDSWLDMMDAPHRISWLKAHRDIGVIAISQVAKDYIQRKLRRDTTLIPEHHCNYEREQRERDEIRTVGVIGNRNAFWQISDEIIKTFADMGLQFVYQQNYEHRQDVIDFYRQLDIQTVWRPHIGKADQHLRNPLKLENAGSFGIPTVAWPEPDYVSEFDGCFLPAHSMEELIRLVKKLKEDRTLYHDMGQKARERAEAYHISNIAKLYLQLDGH